MSLRCKACDKPLNTNDPDYCSICLLNIYKYDVRTYTPIEDIDIQELVKELKHNATYPIT